MRIVSCSKLPGECCTSKRASISVRKSAITSQRKVVANASHHFATIAGFSAGVIVHCNAAIHLFFLNSPIFILNNVCQVMIMYGNVMPAIAAPTMSITQSQLKEAEQLYELIRQRTGKDLPRLSESPNQKVQILLFLFFGVS
jgi:hypothetical protein